MILDQFDQDVISASGLAEDIIREKYGRKISQNSAKKYIAGIRMHLKAKQRTPEPDGRSGLNEVITKYDGTKTVKRMVVLAESDANDPNRIMMLMGFDPVKWELIKIKVKRTDWDVTMKMKSYDLEEGVSKARTWKEKETNHLYSIEMDIKPIQGELSTDDLVSIFDDLEPPKLTKVKYQPGRMMFELPIMDLHLGKRAWAEETGQDDYDLKLADQLYRQTVDDLLGKLDQCNLSIDKIVLPVGQDFFHVDNDKGTTTAGTPVDVDSRWQKLFRVGVDLLVWTIEQLREIAPVEVMYVPGNHDKTFAYFAVYTLAAWYRSCDGVTVDLSPTFRKYVRYGVNLIGFSHGKEGKRIEHLMQQERPRDWGETVFREWHLGDLHHEEAMEIGGVKIRRISSVTALDAWHSEKGYMAQRMAQAFIWDREKGRQFVLDSNVAIAQ
jgi:hypothetical protein